MAGRGVAGRRLWQSGRDTGIAGWRIAGKRRIAGWRIVARRLSGHRIAGRQWQDADWAGRNDWAGRDSRQQSATAGRRQHDSRAQGAGRTMAGRDGWAGRDRGARRDGQPQAGR